MNVLCVNLCIYPITLRMQLLRLFFLFTSLQRTLYSLALQITELYDSVKRKRIELGVLQRTKNLSTILEAQVRLLALDDLFIVFMTLCSMLICIYLMKDFVYRV